MDKDSDMLLDWSMRADKETIYQKGCYADDKKGQELFFGEAVVSMGIDLFI